jgi:hypothetical protein
VNATSYRRPRLQNIARKAAASCSSSTGRLFFVQAWLVVLVRFLGIVALVGFYDTLRVAGPVMILAPILGAVGLTHS